MACKRVLLIEPDPAIRSALREGLEDEHYDAPEAPGFDLILRALSVVHEDVEVLALAGPIFDAVYEYLRRSLLTDRETP